MKYLFAVFVTICFCGSLASAQYANQQAVQSTAGQLPLSGLVQQQINGALNYIVKNIISNVVYYVVKLLALVAAPNATVAIPTLVTALQALGNPTVSALLTAVLLLVGVNGAPILAVFPSGILALQIDGANLLQFLVASIPPGTTAAPFSLVATLLGSYLTQLLAVLTAQ